MRKPINTSAAANRIGVEPQTMRAWRCRGVGPRYIRVGGPRGRCYYDVDELEQWLADRTFQSTSEEAEKSNSN